MAYSPDAVVICTGGEYRKLKLCNATIGFCFVTLEQSHTAPITPVAFCNASVVLKSSLDGTVRAHDLHRYHTFTTFKSPTPVQLLSLTVDPSGEIIVAGTTDPFQIYVWNLQTAKLLDVLAYWTRRTNVQSNFSKDWGHVGMRFMGWDHEALGLVQGKCSIRKCSACFPRGLCRVPTTAKKSAQEQ
jgi:hypothetical protein